MTTITSAATTASGTAEPPTPRAVTWRTHLTQGFAGWRDRRAVPRSDGHTAHSHRLQVICQRGEASVDAWFVARRQALAASLPDPTGARSRVWLPLDGALATAGDPVLALPRIGVIGPRPPREPDGAADASAVRLLPAPADVVSGARQMREADRRLAVEERLAAQRRARHEAELHSQMAVQHLQDVAAVARLQWRQHYEELLDLYSRSRMRGRARLQPWSAPAYPPVEAVHRGDVPTHLDDAA